MKIMNDGYRVIGFIFVLVLLIFLVWKFVTPQGFNDRVRKLIAKGEYQKAESMVMERMQEVGYDPSLYILLGEIYTAWGRYERALEQFLSVPPKGIDKEVKQVLFRDLVALADSCRLINRNITAKRAYEYALQVMQDANIGDGFRFLGDFYFDRHAYPQAALYYEEYLKYGGNKELVLDKLVRSLYEMAEYDRIVRLEKDIKRIGSPKSLQYLQFSYYQVAQKAYKSGKVEDALNLLKKFFQLGNPRYVWEDARMLMARCLLDLGDTLQAIEQLQLVAALGATVNRDLAQAMLDSLGAYRPDAHPNDSSNLPVPKVR